MSTAAARAKYLYNKKYQDAYWERRAKREGLSGDETDKRKSSKKVADEVQLLQTLKSVLLGDLGEPTKCCINRDGYIGKDEKYIKALENSNRIMGSENRRLINLLTQYQKIIGIGVDKIYHEIKMKGTTL
jgi:hypothetical protein